MTGVNKFEKQYLYHSQGWPNRTVSKYAKFTKNWSTL